MKSLGTSTIDARVFEKKKQPSPKKNVRPEKNIPEKKKKQSTHNRKERKNRNRVLTNRNSLAWLFIYLFLPATCGGGTMVEEQWRRR